MTQVTTMAQRTVTTVQPYLCEPSDSNSDQDTEARVSENFSVQPVLAIIIYTVFLARVLVFMAHITLAKEYG